MNQSDTLKQEMKNIFLIIFFLGLPLMADAQLKNIKNDVFWDTQKGTPIYSQGGGIFRFPDPKTGEKKYYWYGVQYQEADIYRKNPSVTLKNATFESVTCYSSTDLVNWNAEGDVLTKAVTNPEGKGTWVGRLGVTFIKEMNKYAMFVQHGSEVLIALADSPTGNFTWHQKINMQPLIGTTNTGDQTVFTDDDGKSYLIYSYGKGRNKIYVSEIGVVDGKINLLDCSKVFEGESREGNCMFKYKNKYYMAASNIYGWDSSFAYYLVSDNIRGPYTPANDMQIMKGSAADYAHVTQTGFFYTIKGKKEETVLYCGDRWADFAGNGLGYNQWFPLSFDGAVPYFNSLSSWNLDEKTGEWTVAKDNNFVMNGSFEADRNKIPSNFKPVQEQLLGWNTEIIKGNKISTTEASSPTLNYFNTEQDRKEVTGEKSLQISDNIDFSRKIKQIISSSPYVALKDGLYTLTARVKNSNGFDELMMYAVSNKKTFNVKITKENNVWETFSISNVAIKNGSIEIGFLASAKADSFCMIDDITLVKNK
ncbi:family 43 glycosylhydrolase [Flavobacterium sp. HJJ]|uniref:family 43 glycosylhydrolase n=1 Tax=Flavobacterium sp. HJJ TaxID=2783792 RepID=UPI00188CF677|nr:family 43 glycosylhydrolase [Flavobacterium sp. HJJ]MBF4472637.1 family 43 glycosylhydrolase [Flavobacterium sp. HJJ]